MKIYGQASAGGPIAAAGVPVPTAPVSRPGSDIVSRLEATHARVSPVGADSADSESKAYVLNRPKRARGEASGRYDRVEIAAQYRRGMSAPQIAKALGCRPNTVYAALKDQGVERRSPGRHKAGAQ